jgi:PAS domain S-box-containing protein
MKTSVKRLVLSAVAAVLGVVMSVFITFDVLEEMDAARTLTNEQVQRIITVGAPLVLGALVVDDLATAEQALHGMNVERVMATLRLVGPDGKVMLDLSKPAPAPAAPTWFRALLGPRLPEIVVAVEAGGTLYGRIAAAPALGPAEAQAWSRARTAALEGMALLVLLFVAVERALAWGLRPIRTLAAAATRFGHGDLSARMPPTRIAEVAETAKAFNTMADELQRLLGELREKDAANRRLAAAIERSDEAIVTLDPKRRIASWNGGAEKLFGIAAAEAAGQPLDILFAGRPASEQAACVARAIAASPTAPYDVALMTRALQRVEVSVSATSLVDDAGQPAGWMVFLRDVTARRQYEAHLADAKRQAEIANRSKSEFLANMSHELRTPLNAVIGFSSVMKDELFGPLNERYRDYMHDIHSSGEHLLQLINDLLDIAAIEADRLHLQDAEVDPRETAESALRLVQQRAETAGVVLSHAIMDEVGTVRADARRLKQMLLNLLTNAVKFTPSGGKVSLVVRPAAGGTLEFLVEDTGMGMDAADIVKALERFGQVDGGLARRHEGSGLGLPLTKSLAELHGGTLRLESQRGVGTRATIVLPANRVLQPAPPPRRAFG